MTDYPRGIEVAVGTFIINDQKTIITISIAKVEKFVDCLWGTY